MFQSPATPTTKKIGISTFVAASCLFADIPTASSQRYIGPFVPNEGQSITTHFTNEFGRDADSTTVITDITRRAIHLDYYSSRGVVTDRTILKKDRDDADVYVLGYHKSMPETIPGTTSLGISGAVLSKLRSTGTAQLTLIYSADLDRIDCTLTATAVDEKVPVIVEDRIFQVPTVMATAQCGGGRRSGTGQVIFANDVNNPVLIQSDFDFSWESRPRTERITRVVSGPGLHTDMEQALNTLGAYDVYGLHFDFDSAKLKPSTAQLVRDIAAMFRSNANWVIQIAGHTDSVGSDSYNLKLSGDRAEAVRQALIREGVGQERLQSVGYGESKPKSDNSTLVGRAINRRVEFRRLDR